MWWGLSFYGTNGGAYYVYKEYIMLSCVFTVIAVNVLLFLVGYIDPFTRFLIKEQFRGMAKNGYRFLILSIVINTLFFMCLPTVWWVLVGISFGINLLAIYVGRRVLKYRSTPPKTPLLLK